MADDVSRRKFLAHSMAAGIGASLHSNAVATSKSTRILGANDRIRVGVVRVGNRGSQLLELFLANEDVQVVALSDVFDALTSQRPYKPAFTCDSALATVRDAVGHHFDPRVHEAFETSLDTIHEVRETFCDAQIVPSLAVARR